MFNLKKSSLLLLTAMIILILIPMSFAADADADDAIAVDADADDAIAVDDVDVSEDLGTTPVPDNGGFAYMTTDSSTIDEGDSFTINGKIAMSYGAGQIAPENELSTMVPSGMTVTCDYTDGNGDSQHYQTTANGYDFSFDGSTFAGLTGGKTYNMAINIVDDGTFAMMGGLTTSYYTLTVNEAAPTIIPFLDVESLFANVEEGSTINLPSGIIDFAGNTVTITAKDVTIVGNDTTIQGYGNGNGIFYVQATGVTIKDIKFNCTNPDSVLTYYDDETEKVNEVKGWGIYFKTNSASNGVVDGCSFYNFNHGVRIQGGAANVVVKNSYFTGVTNYLRNDPTVNVEKGTKAIGIMGSPGAQIINNTFEGPVLDAISIASSSSGTSVINNTFKGNAYAIYFGGAATPGSTIEGNTFENIGHYEGTDAKTGNEVTWTALPLISLEKSASGLTIKNNTFKVVDDNIIIAAEAGNPAHGYPSEIGNITVINNTIEAYDSNVNVASTVLMRILSRGADLNPTEVINVSDNTLNGATPLKYWNVAWGDENGDVVVPAGDKAATYFEVTSITPTALTGVLIDLNGAVASHYDKDKKGNLVAVPGEEFIYNMNGVNTTAETDENGIFIIPNPVGTITLYFLGNEKLAATNLTVNYEAPTVATTISVANLNVKAGDSGNLLVTLKDANGVLAGKTVTIIINGATKTATTNANGIATFNVKYASAGTYNVVASYAGDDTTKSSIGTGKITVAKKASALTAKKATLKVKKVKKIKVTLKSGSTAIAGQKVTIKVNGKTFSAKTNSKGIATIKVKVAKKGKFTATVKFAGNGAYKASTKKVKFTVKK